MISGKGGVLVEIYTDAVLRLASLAFDEAYKISKEVFGLAIIRGYHSMPKGYRKSYDTAVVTISRLASINDTPGSKKPLLSLSLSSKMPSLASMASSYTKDNLWQVFTVYESRLP